MVNIHEFKNKLKDFHKGVDYTYNESEKTYTIHHEKLKNDFWGDSSNEVEYKAMEDSRGNIQFRKSATFRSSRLKKEENDQNPFVHSVEKVRDKQWQEKNLGNFPKITTALSSSSKNEKDNSKAEANFSTGIEEEFGYYKQWEGWGETLMEPTNTACHWKREGNNFFEKKVVWKDNNYQNSVDSSQSQEIGEKEDQKAKKEITSKSDNKNDSSKNIYYGIGLVSLILVVISMLVVWIKRRLK